jgi:hypothetical protein
MRQSEPSKLATPASSRTAISTTRRIAAGGSSSIHATVFGCDRQPIAPEQQTEMAVRLASSWKCSRPCGVLAVAMTKAIPADRTTSSASTVAGEIEKSERTTVPSRSVTTASILTSTSMIDQDRRAEGRGESVPPRPSRS